MAFSGTSVAAGRGTMLVTATGMRAELGRVAGLLQGADPGRTPLQQRLDVLVRRLALAAGVIVVVVFALGLAARRGARHAAADCGQPRGRGDPGEPARGGDDHAGARRPADAAAQRADPPSVRGRDARVGDDDLLGQDRHADAEPDDRRRARHGRRPAGPDRRAPADPSASRPCASSRRCGCCSRAARCATTPRVADDGSLLGDPTETALVAVLRRYGLDKDDLEAVAPRVGELPFDSDAQADDHRARAARRPGGGARAAARRSSTRDQIAAPGGRVAFTKGALDGLLARCDAVDVGGTAVALDDEPARARALAAGERLAGEGVRVLGVAMRIWPDPATRPARRRAGGRADVARPGGDDRPAAARRSRDAVATCREAGIRPVMITGDHPLTAAAIARELGLADDDARGRDRRRARRARRRRARRDRARRRRCTRACRPEHKLRIVEALQRDGQVVAMTGDGVNDAPALKQADIGVAMGITGTDVTKEPADMVLLDDNFATIVGAVREGRVIFDNIRKFIRNILSGNVAEIGRDGPRRRCAGMPIPLLPLQILWLNLVTDGLPAMALAVEPAERGVMQRPPTPLGESLLGSDRGLRILMRGAALTCSWASPPTCCGTPATPPGRRCCSPRSPSPSSPAASPCAPSACRCDASAPSPTGRSSAPSR